MSTIRQLVALNVGGPLQLSTAPVPQPGPGEVSVRPRAVSLNPVDYKNLAFAAAMRWWPHVLGIEGAGIVEAVGRGVSSLEPGDEVVALVETIVSEGVFREVFVAPEKAVFKKPAALSFEEATSLP
jgi:NADPH:quinone reductase-like Zn-dependent oxidoreductase